MLVFRGVEHDGFFPAKGGIKPCFKKTWVRQLVAISGLSDSRDDVTTPLKMNGWFTSKSLPIEIRKIIWTKNLHDFWLQNVWFFPSDSPPSSLTIFALASCQHSCFKKLSTILHSHSLQQTGCFKDGFRYLISLGPPKTTMAGSKINRFCLQKIHLHSLLFFHFHVTHMLYGTGIFTEPFPLWISNPFFNMFHLSCRCKYSMEHLD